MEYWLLMFIIFVTCVTALKKYIWFGRFLKKSKSCKEKQEEKKLDILDKLYVFAAYTNMLVKQHMTLYLTSVFLAGNTKKKDYTPKLWHYFFVKMEGTFSV